MKTLFASLFLGVALVSLLAAAPAPNSKIPSELVGEWATAKSEFVRGFIVSGSVAYVFADGSIVLIGTPPPIGIRGEAVYDPKVHTLTVALFDDSEGDRIRQTVVFAHDVRAKTLSTVPAKKTPEAYIRRSAQIPEHIVQMRKEAKSQNTG